MASDIVEDTVVTEDVTASATHDEVLGNQISAGFINDEERQMGADLLLHGTMVKLRLLRSYVKS